MNIRTPSANIEHKAVIDALAQRKPDLAASMMHNHMLASFMHYSGADLQNFDYGAQEIALGK